MWKNFTFIGLIGLIPFLVGWGATGHRVVGEVAEQHLKPLVKKKVLDLLEGESVAEASTWGDETRSMPEWKHSAPWHYINVEDAQEIKVLSLPPSAESIGDVLQAIAFFERATKDPKQSKAKRAEALLWLLHFVGDVHMPLHVGKAEDRGGGSVQVHWFGSPTNLHRVWDDEVIDHSRLSFTEIARFVGRRATDANVKAWQAADVLEWARESKTLRAKCYEFDRNTVPPQLSWNYYNSAWEIISQRLAQAGVRLAGLLNRAFGSP